MNSMPGHSDTTLFLLLHLSCQLLHVLALCPAPFNLEASKCVFVNTAQSYSWCSANQQCASIGGELINSYSSIKLLGSMPSLNCGCKLWIGVSDMADERDSSRSGWQMINDNGILPTDNSLWVSVDPNGGSSQDCIMRYSTGSGKLADQQCSALLGFACEFPASAPSQPLTSATWKQTPFKNTSYNPSTEYCYTDLLQVVNSIECMAAAVRAGNSRHVLYNSKLRTCRLLQFTDAQVEQEIETSANWTKFSVQW